MALYATIGRGRPLAGERLSVRHLNGALEMFASDNALLFNKGDLRPTLSGMDAKIPEQVDAIPKGQFLATSEDTLVEALVDQLRVEPLAIHNDRMEQSTEDTKVDVTHDPNRSIFPRYSPGPVLVPGTRIVVSIPFSGSTFLWDLQPNAFDFNPPRGNILGESHTSGRIELVFEHPSDAATEQLRNLVNEQLVSIKRYAANQAAEIEGRNAQLPNKIREAIRARRRHIEANEKISSALGIPLKRRGDAFDIRTLPLKKRVVRTLPAAPKEAFRPEPGISEEDYDYILKVIRHEGRTFEANPRTFRIHGEEELRDILLAHLNGHYEGEATGETFRKRGKTDIRIETEDRAAFVAECKIWRGPESLKEAASQLLGYLTWRDGKTALIFFNVNVKGFKGIQDKIPELLHLHELFLREKPASQAGEWRAAFRLKDDEAREVIVHVFLFDLHLSV
jgi:hypothetical protein